MDRDRCLCLHVQRAARALARRFDDAFRPLDLRHGQFSMLLALRHAEPATMRRIADLLAMDRTTLTANLKPLERRGLVKVSVDPDDGRSRLIRLTGAGRALLAKAIPVWQREHRAVVRSLAPSDPERLLADLVALA